MEAIMTQSNPPIIPAQQMAPPAQNPRSNLPIVLTIIAVGVVLTIVALVCTVALNGTNLKPVAVTVGFRPSALMGLGQNSFVATIRNEGTLLRKVTIIAKNSSLNTQKVFEYDEWSPGQVREIGWQEGWKFYPGDAVVISAPGYLPFTYKFAK
jgi:hypothetical protein